MPPELGELKDEWREDPAAVVAGIMRRQAFAEWRADTVSSLLEICMRCFCYAFSFVCLTHLGYAWLVRRCTAAHRERRPSSLHTHHLLVAELRALENSGSSAASSSSAPSQSHRKDCIICMDALRNTRLLPCQHQLMCSNCAALIRQSGTPLCPLCRATIDHVEEGQQFGFHTMAAGKR